MWFNVWNQRITIGKLLIMRIIKEKTASITGHRPKFLPWGYNENKKCCSNFKDKIEKVFEDAIKYGIDTFLTGVAEGFDMIGAEILFDLRKVHNIKVIAVVPCLGQELSWKLSQQTRYKNILSLCDDVIVLSKEYYDGCMIDRNKYMVQSSSVCIACFNGKLGGTYKTILLAKENSNKIKIVNPNKFA